MRNLLSIYLDDLELNNYSKATLKTYRNNLKKFISYIESINITDIEDINMVHIKQYLATYDHHSAVHVNNQIKSIKAWYRWLIEYEYVEKNVTTKIKKVKEPKTLINTYTDEEILSLLNAYDGKDYLSVRNKCIITLLVETGIRALELCKIEMDDIATNYIIIKGKGNRIRQVGVTPPLRKILNRYIRCRNRHFKAPNNYLFLSRNNNMLDVNMIELIIKNSNAKIRPTIRNSCHTIRHYFAQKQMLNNLDIYSISRVLGHENVATTNTYLRSMNNDLVIEKVNKHSVIHSINKR